MLIVRTIVRFEIGQFWK